MKTALVTGVSGQDGYYLSKLLLEKNYKVIGLVRRNSRYDLQQFVTDIGNKNFILETGDLTDISSIISVLKKYDICEFYNLAAQSHVGISFTNPISTTDINSMGVVNCLEAIRLIDKDIKFYQASSSELYGDTVEEFQDENTPFRPRSPYGCSKLFSFAITKNYREAYNMFTSNGILFNHESPRRSINFVTRKVTSTFAKINSGMENKLDIGNLDAKRDWGYAKDYVEMMWRILDHNTPDDFVIATGEVFTVRQMIEMTAHYFEYDIKWDGKGIDEIGYDSKSGKKLVVVNPDHFRPSEVEYLRGDFSKAKEILKWEPKTSFEQLIKIMCDHDKKLFS